jgi:hypothetical protein
MGSFELNKKIAAAIFFFPSWKTPSIMNCLKHNAMQYSGGDTQTDVWCHCLTCEYQIW